MRKLKFFVLHNVCYFDRKTLRDGYLNRYTFTKDGRKTILTPLSSKEVYEDQCKLERLRVEAERKERESRKSTLEGEKNKSENTKSRKSGKSEKK